MLTDSFAFYISVLRKHFTSYCTEKLSEMGITYGQLYILIYTGKKQECSPKEISASLKLDAGHLNRTLTKLAENQLIIQEKNPNDKRANIVKLTKKGQEVFNHCRNLFQDWDKLILTSLKPEEQQQLMELMKKICTSQSDIYISFRKKMEDFT